MIAFDRRGRETRQKNGTFKSIEDVREVGQILSKRALTSPHD